MSRRRPCNAPGFTLIELVLTIVVIGILAAAALPYIMQGTVPGARPVDQLKDSLLLNAVMANIVADFQDEADKTTAIAQFHNTRLTDQRYGQGINDGQNYGYSVVENTLVKYDIVSGAESGGTLSGADYDALKVTIASTANPGKRLTYLLTVD